MATIFSVHITTPTRIEAEKIARALLQEKLAACVNILPGIRSIYRWQGKVEETEEALLIAKTRAEQFEALRKLVKALHPAECPCIVAETVTAGHQPYLDWVAGETAR